MILSQRHTCWMLLSFVIVDVVAAYDNIYPFKDNCADDIERLDVDDTVYVTYDGEPLLLYVCSIFFQGKGDVYLDEYEVCVEPTSFEIRNCNIKVIFSSGSFHNQTYSCNDYPEKFCTVDRGFLHIQIFNADRYTEAKFNLRVYAVKIYDDNKRVSIIAGSISGGLVLCCIVVCVVVLRCRRNRRKNTQRAITQNNHLGQSSAVCTISCPSAPPQQSTSQAMTSVTFNTQ